MSYIRVLPRDAFNEAGLLKCIGKLTLLIEDGMLPDWTYDYDGGPFEIEQNQADGSISVRNVTFTKGDSEIWLSTPLNSRRAWPLKAEGGGYDGDFVFDDSGKFCPTE